MFDNFIEINLLPKSYQKKSLDFSLGKTGVYIMGAAAVVIVMLIAVTFYQRYQLSQLDENINRAKQRAAMLQKDIQLVDALTDVKNKVQERMQAVERLDSHRSAWVRILENIARNVPEFVWMGRFEELNPKAPNKQATQANANSPGKKDNNDNKQATEPKSQSLPTVRKAEIEGYAFTLNALASFMIKMMRSDYFDEVELVSSKEVVLEKQKAYNFVLTCNVHYLSDEELRDKIASADQDKQQASSSHKSLN